MTFEELVEERIDLCLGLLLCHGTSPFRECSPWSVTRKSGRSPVSRVLQTLMAITTARSRRVSPLVGVVKQAWSFVASHDGGPVGTADLLSKVDERLDFVRGNSVSHPRRGSSSQRPATPPPAFGKRFSMQRSLLRTTLSLGAILLLLSGCATIFTGDSQTVRFSSEPSAVSFELIDSSGKVIHQGVTPAVVELKRGSGFFQSADLTLRASHGGRTTEMHLDQKFAGWYLGNVIFGGLIGILVVDPATGAMWSFDENVHFDLEDPDANTGLEILSERTRNPVEGGISVLSLDDVPDALRSSLVRLR
jgi:hypothetical protein